MSHVLVVGSGIAGLYTALELRRLSDVNVTILVKGTLRESNTWHAQGGIAAVLPPSGDAAAAPDSIDLHIADTLAAGAGHCDVDAVRVLCSDAARHLQRLIRLGAAFDRTPDGRFSLGREAAHAAARILHIGGDATGAGITDALIRAAEDDPGIVLEQHSFLGDLVLTNGEVSAAVVVRDGKARTVAADAVVLATGGAGQMFTHTTNPGVATGDGVAAAWRAGAVVADLEFFQFHPTSLNVPGHPLISEAVRGEGAVLRDGLGRRFLPDYHPAGELAPRDVVSRSIAMHLGATGGEEVFLDATALGADFLAARFPTLTAVIRQAGFDWAREQVPVVPAAHYWMGGVATDARARTSLPGLYAVGEVARSGVHGANRLASNSLLEGLVFGAQAAASILVPRNEWPAMEAEPLQLQDGPENTAPDAIRRVMADHAAILRDDAGLRIAAKQLGHWVSAGDSLRGRETANLLTCARLLTHAAGVRRESRGAHHRTDFPGTAAPASYPTFLRRFP